jgi:hypothetical protein
MPEGQPQITLGVARSTAIVDPPSSCDSFISLSTDSAKSRTCIIAAVE